MASVYTVFSVVCVNALLLLDPYKGKSNGLVIRADISNNSHSDVLNAALFMKIY